MKEQGIIYDAPIPRSIYFVARLARQWMTKAQLFQTSRLVWWMVKSGHVFYSLARESKIHVVMVPVEAGPQDKSNKMEDEPGNTSANFPKSTNSSA